MTRSSTWFSISATQRGTTCVLTCSGELDAATAGRVLDAGTLCLDAGVLMLVIDCAGITFVDSTGIEAVSELVRRCRETGTGFSIVPGERVRAVAEKLGRADDLGITKRVVPVGGTTATSTL